MLAGLLVVLTACSGNNSTPAANGNGDSKGKTTTLKFFHRWPNEPRNSYFNYIKEEFEKQNPGVKIEMESVLNDNYKEKIKVLVSSGTSRMSSPPGRTALPKVWSPPAELKILLLCTTLIRTGQKPWFRIS